MNSNWYLIQKKLGAAAARRQWQRTYESFNSTHLFGSLS